MIEDLKSEVEKVFGKKVASRGDCEQLSDEIYLITKQNLNYNTLRRFFGLAKSTKPRAITLDILSNFIGYSSFIEFRKKHNTLDYWDDWERAFLLLTDGEMDLLFDLLREERRKGKDFDSLIVVVARELILRKDFTSFHRLISEKWMSYKHRNYSSVVYFGNTVGPLLAKSSISDAQLCSLLREKNYQYSVFAIFVDYGEIHGFLGRHIDLISQEKISLDKELRRFVECLGLLKFIWSEGYSSAISTFNVDLKPKLEDHPILFGRILGMQLIYYKNNQIKRAKLKAELFSAITKNPDVLMDYFYELITIGLYFNDLWIFDLLYECVNIDGEIGPLFWYHNRNYMYIKLMFAFRFMHIGEVAKAKQNIQGFVFDKIRTSNKVFLELYYLILMYHTTSKPAEKEVYALKYETIAEILNFKGIDKAYLTNYFSPDFESPYEL